MKFLTLLTAIISTGGPQCATCPKTIDLGNHKSLVLTKQSQQMGAPTFCGYDDNTAMCFYYSDGSLGYHDNDACPPYSGGFSDCPPPGAQIPKHEMPC
ncbi:hypothetical protein AURDEDRAFT_169332 [Auricularia subglabra TFB-10046 SS5]|nr:hypothetical protein AURDEDRAFT_169332 [Auricularia subglabra TFB-10046 SS5]